jgi:hypothetical protein
MGINRKEKMSNLSLAHPELSGYRDVGPDADNPNTGEEIDDYRCTLSWLPILLLEGASQTRQAGAAIESFRNEVAQGQRDAALGIAHARSEPPLKVIGKIEAAE